MWLCIATALALTPAELADAAAEAQEQLDACAADGCRPDKGAQAAFIVAVHRYQDEGVADGDLAATVRVLDPDRFEELPDVLQKAGGSPLPWAAPPAVPEPPNRARPLLDVSPGCDPDRRNASDRAARVIVPRWIGSDTRYDTRRLQRTIEAQLEHPGVVFVPGSDAYQLGRIDPSLAGEVPMEALMTVVRAAHDTSRIPAEALSEEAWAERARALEALSDTIWFIDTPALREAAFLLYAQIGRAASIGGLEEAPFREPLGQLGEVDTYLYRAAVLAHNDPSLVDGLQDDALRASIDAWRERVAAAEPVRLSFAEEDRAFDPKAFAAEYRLFVDGIETIITNTDGLLEVPPGRTDIALRRADGHGLSERVAFTATDRIYFVRPAARNALEVELIQQLMENANECSPRLDDGLRRHLAVYQALHPDEDVYVAVAVRGATSKGKLHLWWWSPEEAGLAQVMVR